MTHTAKELKPTRELPGLSQRQIEEHHDVLYKGYVNKLNEIETKLASADPAEANATFSLIRELKREEVFATNAIRLHEGYFENLGGAGAASGPIAELIAEDFGSYQKWEADFRALGIAARGWVWLAWDYDERRMFNFLGDAQNTFPVWNAVPVAALDTYEHAYFIDYGVNRGAYIDAFMKNLDWPAIQKRFDAIKM